MAYLYLILLLLTHAIYSMDQKALAKGATAGQGSSTHLRTPREERALKKILRNAGLRTSTNMECEDNLEPSEPCTELMAKTTQQIGWLKLLTGQNHDGPFEETALPLAQHCAHTAKKFLELEQGYNPGISNKKLKNLTKALRAQQRAYRGPKRYEKALALLDGIEVPSGDTSIQGGLDGYKKLLDAARLLRCAASDKHAAAQPLLDSRVKQLMESFKKYFAQDATVSKLNGFVETAEKALTDSTNAEQNDAIQSLTTAVTNFVNAYYIHPLGDYLKKAAGALTRLEKFALSNARLMDECRELKTQLDTAQAAKKMIEKESAKNDGALERLSSGNRATRSHAKAAPAQSVTTDEATLFNSSLMLGLQAIGFKIPREALMPCLPTQPEHASQANYYHYWYHNFMQVLGQLLGQPTGSTLEQNNAAFPVIWQISTQTGALARFYEQSECPDTSLPATLGSLDGAILKAQYDFYGPHYHSQGLESLAETRRLRGSNVTEDVLSRLSHLLVAQHRMECALMNNMPGSLTYLTEINAELDLFKTNPPATLKNFVKEFDRVRIKLGELKERLLKWHADNPEKNHGDLYKKQSPRLETLITLQTEFQECAEKFANLCNSTPTQGLLECVEESLKKADSLTLLINRINSGSILMTNPLWDKYKACKKRLEECADERKKAGF